MTYEQKRSLGPCLKAKREERGWTQELLQARSGVNLRAIQRAEAGEGVGKENLAGIAEAFGMDVAELQKACAEYTVVPVTHLILEMITSDVALLDPLRRSSVRGCSVEIGPPGEHPFNEAVGEQLLELEEVLQNSAKRTTEEGELRRGADRLLKNCQKFGFGLFFKKYRERINSEMASAHKTVFLFIAAPLSDSRVVKKGKGFRLDVVRDSRRLAFGQLFGAGQTLFDWMEHQSKSKSNGEQRVADMLRELDRRSMQAS